MIQKKQFSEAITANIGVVEELVFPNGKIPDGIFIMYHSKQDDYPRMVKPNEWTVRQNSGEIAEGVVIVEGGKMLVVAPTGSSTTLNWSSAAVNGGGTMATDRVAAFNDWAGKENTASQIQHAECSGTNYAPGCCASYSRTNANGHGLTAGKWWLPSMGEMMMIYAHLRDINAALELIDNAECIVTDYYWTSTESSSTNAWGLYISEGYAYSYSLKSTGRNRIRAVSTFLL